MPPRSPAMNAPSPSTKRGNPETLLQARIVAAIGAMSFVRVFRNNIGVAVYDSGARVEYGVGGKGAPDLLCEVQHKGLWIACWMEIKTPDGHVDPDQRKWHAAARKMGRNVAVVRDEPGALAVVGEVAAFGSVLDGWEVEVSRG
jgi:hypothetical protein